MSNLYAVCFKCEHTISYAIHGDVTTFQRGEWLVHQDHIVTGFKTDAKAKECLRDDPYNMKEPANRPH